MANKIAAALLLAGLSGLNASAVAAGFEVIVPHRAVYEISLLKASDRSGIKKMDGRMVYEVRGNECDGISLNHRFLTTVSRSRDVFVTDQHTSTFESADGKEFTFLSKSFLNEQLEETVKGRAIANHKGINVSLTSPAEQVFDFPKASFLTSYLVKLIGLAKDGEHFMRDDIFDGSDGADETISTSSVISKLKSVRDSRDGFGDAIKGKLDAIDAWHVSMSYFDKKIGASAEHLPMFESSFLMYANGISSDLVMRYPDYTLVGKLTALELFDHSACTEGG